MMCHNSLKDKKILLIAPEYFGYENNIIAELESAGAIVFYIPENIDYKNFKYKLLNKFPEKFRNKIYNKYFISEFKKFEHIDFDIVFCIRIDLFNNYILEFLKRIFRNATFVLYFWDSCKNMRNAEVISTYFDKIYTFDKNDADSHITEGWKFRPLFFIKDYSYIGKNHLIKTTDLLYIATLSKERARYCIQLLEYCNKNGLSLDVYFFCKNSIFYWNRIFIKEFRQIPRSYIHSKSLSKETIIKKFEHSKVVFDCSHSSQSGLTMRTIECLGASKKMITTNKQILEYDFYNQKNILLLDGYDFSKIKQFIYSNDFQDLEDQIRYKYSINGWIEEILL